MILTKSLRFQLRVRARLVAFDLDKQIRTACGDVDVADLAARRAGYEQHFGQAKSPSTMRCPLWTADELGYRRGGGAARSVLPVDEVVDEVTAQRISATPVRRAVTARGGAMMPPAG